MVKKKFSDTGIKELDSILTGGFPKGSVVLVAGSSGAGKTMFAFQWLFEGAKKGEKGIYITLTEPIFKAIQNIENMSYYDRNVIENEDIKMVDIREIINQKLVVKQGIKISDIKEYFNTKKFHEKVIIDFIEKEVKKTNAKRLCIDSITALAYLIDNKARIRRFIFELGKVLATLGCTTLITSEVTEPDKYSVYNVEEYISDAILRLDQVQEQDRRERRLRIIKVRGKAYRTEDIFFKITKDGLKLFPKLSTSLNYEAPTNRVSIGNVFVDKLFGGGVYEGSSTLISGPTGTGKTIFSMQFAYDSLLNGKKTLFVSFEESESQIIRDGASFGYDFEEYKKNKQLFFRCVYPTEKLLEEHLTNIKEIVEKENIERCVIDSLSAMHSSFNETTFMSFTKRLISFLKSKNITSIYTFATESLIGTQQISKTHLSTLIDNIILLRYVEMKGSLELVMNVLKERGSNHSKELYKYQITEKGLVVEESLKGYEGIITGVSKKVSQTVVDKLSEIFLLYLGPMAEVVMNDLKNKGINKENVLKYIEDLTDQKIISKKDASSFKEKVEYVFGKQKTNLKGVNNFFKK